MMLLDAASVLTDRGIRINAIVRIAVTTGLRPIEIANISLDDICFKAALLTIPLRKGKKTYCSPLT